jgi:N-acetylmuramoyl-L-alanine amidase
MDMQPGMRVVLTRSTDIFIPLRERVIRARRAHADLFVSIHADAAYNRQAQGASVYTLSERGASSAAARLVAARENASDLASGVAIDDKEPLLAKVLVDMSLSATMEASRQAAWNVLSKMHQIGEVHTGSVQYAGFAVLKAADIPGMLVETAYISNAEEEMKLRHPEFQEQIAGAVFSGIQEFFRNRPPAGTRIAQALIGSRNSSWDRR